MKDMSEGSRWYLNMNVKALLYIITFTLSLYAMQSVNYEKFLKANRVTEARILFMLLCMSISYLCTNFIYDFFTYTSIM
jgi:uncharacterized integral membrane protein (TIGR02327 family)